MRPSVELYVDEGKAEATGVCLGLESLTKRGEFSSAMARNCTVTALEDSFLMQFALEATNSVLVEGTSHPRPTPNLNPKPIPHPHPHPNPNPDPNPNPSTAGRLLADCNHRRCVRAAGGRQLDRYSVCACRA